MTNELFYEGEYHIIDDLKLLNNRENRILDFIKNTEVSSIKSNNSSCYCLIMILIVGILTLVLNSFVYFYVVPSDINEIRNGLSQINKLSKYENEIDVISNKFNNIYGLIENICKKGDFKDICINITLGMTT